MDSLKKNTKTSLLKNLDNSGLEVCSQDLIFKNNLESKQKTEQKFFY